METAGFRGRGLGGTPGEPGEPGHRHCCRPHGPHVGAWRERPLTADSAHAGEEWTGGRPWKGYGRPEVSEGGRDCTFCCADVCSTRPSWPSLVQRNDVYVCRACTYVCVCVHTYTHMQRENTQGPAQITPFYYKPFYYKIVSTSLCDIPIPHSSTPCDILGEMFNLPSISCETLPYPPNYTQWRYFCRP